MAKSEQVSKRRNNVIQLPCELNRLRSADRLIKEWLVIQDVDDCQNKVAALVDWRECVRDHRTRFVKS